MSKNYRETHAPEKRLEEFNRIKIKHPDKIPIIVEKAKTSTLPDIDKCKFLIPADVTVGQFQAILRNRISLKPDEAIFMFTDDMTLPVAAMTMGELYKQHHATVNGQGEFSYFLICNESTFGSL